MRLLSWNCRGLGNPCTVLELLLLIKEQGPLVLFLSETRLDSLSVEWLRVKLKFGGAFCVPRVRTGGGLAMLWTDKAKVGVNTYSKNHIDASVLDTVTQKEFRVTGFYGNAETHRRRESWALLKPLSSLSSLPWVCMGDFNEVLDYWEVKGRRARPLWQIQDFRDAVAHCELHDLGFEGNQFTWRNKRSSDDFVTGRLDRMLGTSSWISDFKGAVVSHLAVQNSDHCPLLLTIPTPQAITKKKKLFRFEAMWVKDEQCRGVIEQAWRKTVERGSLMFKVVEKLKCCRASLILWSKERFGSIAASIKAKRLLLQNLINTTPSGHSDRIMEVQAELNELLLKEEIYWKQRSRVSWMRDGDKNTKFFHAHCSQRRQTNFIRGLRDSGGVWHIDKSKMVEIAVDYFRDIFSSSNPEVEAINKCLDGLERVVSPEMNDLLLEDFKAEEVAQALKQMYPTKAPSPDGMSAIFYQTYWEVVGPEVTQAVLSILHSGYLLRKINFTHIALVPKIKNPEKNGGF